MFFFFVKKRVAKCVVFATQGCESAISKQYVSYLLSLPPISPPGPIPLGHHRALGDSPVLYSSFPLYFYFVLYFYSVLLYILFCIFYIFIFNMYICQCYSLNSSNPLLPLLCPPVHSLHLCLYSYPENRFIRAIFLDSIYVH